MDAALVQSLFTRKDGTYLFARWGRPIVPVVFGVDDATLSTVKGAIEAIVALAGHKMAETDPELGANLMVFFFRDWDELRHVKDLDRLIPDLNALVSRLEAAQANQYRAFRFDPAGAIRASFVFLRMDATLSSLPAIDLALSQAVNAILLWGDQAFDLVAPLVSDGRNVLLNPQIAAIVQAGYDPIMPATASDPSHALRIAARLTSKLT